MTEKVIRELAVNKAFAKIAMLVIRVKDAKEDVRTRNYGPVGMEELELLYNGYKKELKVWNFIAELIEKSEK
jgi:hypothetical protein